MAKKSKDNVLSTANVANKDILQRLNFLYQSSAYLASLSSGEGPGRGKAKATSQDLARQYVEDMKVVSQKTTVRMDPGVKRTLCSGCNQVLIPGRTTRVRVRTSRTHGHVMTYTCISCNTSLRIPAPPTIDDIPTPGASTDMIVEAESSGGPQRRRKKRRTEPHPPPLATRRDAGHIILTGNQSIPLNEEGSGVFIL